MLIHRVISAVVKRFYKLTGKKMAKYISAYGTTDEGLQFFVKFERPEPGAPFEPSGRDGRIINDIVHIIHPQPKD